MPRPDLSAAHDAHCVDCSRACIWLAMSSSLTGLSSTPVALKPRSPPVQPQALQTTMVIDVPTLMAIAPFAPMRQSIRRIRQPEVGNVFISSCT